jgi:arginyl-tRNA synthetase
MAGLEHTETDVDPSTLNLQNPELLIINDLKQKTSKDYKISWGKALAHSGDAGVKLQHSRLTSLVEAAKVSLENSDVTSIDTTSLQESIALDLFYHIAHYDEVLSIS